MLAAIRELEKRDDVLSAAPNRIYTVDTEEKAVVAETPCADASVNSTGGDFDGDGQDEIVTFYGYDYGTDLPYMRMWMFKISSDGTLGYSCLGQTGWWEAPNINGRVTAGDCDQDGLDEVAVLYDYGSMVKLWLFERNADGTMAHDVILETKIITGADATGRMFSGTYSTLGGEEVGILYTTTLRSELCVMGLTDEHVGYYSRYF